MRFFEKDITKKRFITIFYCLLFVLLIYLGTQTGSSNSNNENNFTYTSQMTSFLVNDTTTTVLIEETVTTVEEITVTTIEEVVASSTTTEVVSTKNTFDSSSNFSDLDGPPHNLTTLVGCISYYESTWGIDPNVFQFVQSTWEAYGGVGSPENAPYWRQEEIFWLAWEDSGQHHWAAQKGRCF